MESPPPYSPPGKKNNTPLIVGLVLGGVALCCILPLGLGGFGLFKAMKGGFPLVSCAMGFDQMRHAVVDYANANGGTLPAANKWMDQVRPYYKKRMGNMDGNPFPAIPAEGVWACTAEDGSKSGIAYNSVLSGKKLNAIEDRSATIVLFEVPDPALNRAEPYKPQDKAKSPKLFGNPRGWFTIHLTGDALLGDQKFDFSEGKGNVKVKSE